jgi:uncharacterized protein
LRRYYDDSPLSTPELYILETFLISSHTSDETMPISCLDGYLTALALSPVKFSINHWLPPVWGGRVEFWPKFATSKQAQQILGLILRRKRSIETNFSETPIAFSPIFDYVTYPDHQYRPFVDGEMWATGFMQCIEREIDVWKPVYSTDQVLELLEPIAALGGSSQSEVQRIRTASPNGRATITAQIPDSIAAIHQFWQTYIAQPAQHRQNQNVRSSCETTKP